MHSPGNFASRFAVATSVNSKVAMALSIILDKPGPYCPGATITGHVELSSSSDEAIAYIDINFTGRCKVKIRKHDHYTTISYRSRGYYFSQHLSLYAEGKYKHKAGTYMWPFTFTIPDHASRRLVSGPITAGKTPTSWRPQRQLTAMGVLQPGVGHEPESDFFSVKPPFQASALNALQPHPLPDSFAYSHGGFPADFEGRVEYTLVATLTRPSGSILFSPKNLEASAPIVLKSYRSRSMRSLALHLWTHKSTHTISTLRLLPSNMDRKLTFLERTRSVLNSSTIPTCTFQTVITTPRYVSPATNPSDSIPFSITVSRLKLPQSDKTDANFDDIPTPVVKLTTFSLWIRARTLLRDNGKAAIDQTVDYEDRVFNAVRTGLDIDIPILNASPKPKLVGMTGPSSPPKAKDARASKSPDAKSPDAKSPDAKSPDAKSPDAKSPDANDSKSSDAGDSKSPDDRDSKSLDVKTPEPLPKLDLGKILNLRLEPNILPPDFSTYNIYRSYTLGFKLKLEALGESMDVSQDGIKIRVLQELDPTDTASPTGPRNAPRAPPTPPPDNDTHDEKGGSFPPEPPPDANAAEDQLPQYEHHAPEGPLPAFER